ncbi:CHAD domain-containing protein [Robbsia andropogonis]|uniref:CHAD domain-containing protein n=1 Tax=Robbsia andropogonis TaxID=28092 RepID=UPI003D201EE3
MRADGKHDLEPNFCPQTEEEAAAINRMPATSMAASRDRRGDGKPDSGDPVKSARDAGACAAVQDYAQLARPLWETVRARTHEFKENRGGAAPETIHAMRVALRRLKALQWAYRPRLDAGVLTAEREVTRRLMRTAAGVRDWDITLALADEWVPRLTKARATLSVVREDAVNSGIVGLARHARDIDASVVLQIPMCAESVNATTSSPVDLVFLAGRLSKARKQLRTCEKKAVRDGHYDALHAVRKAGKRVRDLYSLITSYTEAQFIVARHAVHADAMHRSSADMMDVPAVKKSKKRNRWAAKLLTKRQIKRLQRVQSRFGALNDAVASATLLRTICKRSSRFARTPGIERLIHTLDDVAQKYERKATSLL